MSQLRNRIEALQSKTSSVEVLNACNEALRRIDNNQSYLKKLKNLQPQNEEAAVSEESSVLADLLEALKASNDNSAKQFVSFCVIEEKIAELNNLGVKSSFDIIKESEIAKHPAFSYMFERLKPLAVSPEWMVIENVISSLNAFNWDPTVNECLRKLSESFEKHKEEITIYKIVENIKRSASSYLLSGFSTNLEEYLNSRTSSSRIGLMEKISKFNFDANVKSLYNFLSEAERSFHVAVNDNTCTISRVYSPISLTEACEYFVVEGRIYKKFENTITAATDAEMSSLPESFKALATFLSKDNVKVGNDLIKIYSGDKVVEITESEIKINGNLVKREDIHKVYLNAGVFRMHERQDINAIFAISENWGSIFEIDFAKTINSKAEPHKSVTIFSLGESFYINKTNRLMNESVLYTDCNATQTKNLVLEYMKTDISSSFTSMLSEEAKQIQEAKNLKSEYLEAISFLNSQKEKLDRVAGMVESAELKELIQSIDEEIDMLKSQYSKVELAQSSASKLDEGMGVAVGDTAMLGKKK